MEYRVDAKPLSEVQNDLFYLFGVIEKNFKQRTKPNKKN